MYSIRYSYAHCDAKQQCLAFVHMSNTLMLEESKHNLPQSFADMNNIHVK